MSAAVHSQVSQSVRKEIEQEEGYSFNIYPFKEKGVLIKYKNEDKKERANELNFEMVNSEFNTLKTKKIVTSKDFDENYSFYSDDHLYFFELNFKKGDFQCHSIQIPDLESVSAFGTLPKKSVWYDHRVIDGKMFIATRVKKEHIIQVVDMKSGKYMSVRPESEADADLGFNGIESIEYEGRTEILFKYTSCIKKECEFKVFAFDSDGNRNGKVITFPKHEEYTFLTVKLNKESDDKYAMLGTYAYKGSGANGFFTAKASQGKVSNVKYYNFLEMPNYLDFYSDRAQKKIEKKQEKSEKKGKEFAFSYNVLVHQIYKQNDQYILVGEFYYPTYVTVTSTSYVNGKPVTTTRREFDGYQYSKALVTAFDTDGELVWSNFFPMYLHYKPFSVKSFIRVKLADDKVDLAYINQNLIKTITFEDGEIVNEADATFVQAMDDDDVIKTASIGNMTYWYDNFYIAFGYQKIKNKEMERGNKKRKVFYLNKVSYN